MAVEVMPMCLIMSGRQTGWQYSDGDPLTGASNARGMKNHDFRPISGFISELMQDRAMVTKLSNGTILNDLERPLPRFHGYDII